MRLQKGDHDRLKAPVNGGLWQELAVSPPPEAPNNAPTEKP